MKGYAIGLNENLCDSLFTRKQKAHSTSSFSSPTKPLHGFVCAYATYFGVEAFINEGDIVFQKTIDDE